MIFQALAEFYGSLSVWLLRTPIVKTRPLKRCQHAINLVDIFYVKSLTVSIMSKSNFKFAYTGNSSKKTFPRQQNFCKICSNPMQPHAMFCLIDSLNGTSAFVTASALAKNINHSVKPLHPAKVIILTPTLLLKASEGDASTAASINTTQ